MKKRYLAVFGICLSSPAFAQQQATLPEIEVRPPASDSNATPGNSGAIPSTGGSGSGADATQPYNGPGSSLQNPMQFGQGFPSLSDQTFGGIASNPTGLNSVLRGDSDLFTLPQLATIVDRETLDRRQSSSMYRALQNEVGVLLQQTGNGQLSPFIRGLTGQQILVLVDGIRMNTSILRPGPNQYTATIDPGMIERIEIIRGAESAMWGSDAIGGVINVVTRSADPLRGDHLSPTFTQYWSSAEASSYTRTGFGGWYGQTGVFGGVSYMDVGNVDRGGGLGRQPATDYDQYAADIKINRMLGSDHMFTFALQHFEQQDLSRSDRFLPFVLGPAPNGSVPVQRPTVFDPQQRDLGYFRFEGLVDDELMFADAYSITFSGTRTKEGSVIDRYANNTPTAQPTLREVGEFDDWGWGTVIGFSKDNGDYGKLFYGADFYDENIDAVRTTQATPNNANPPAPRPADPQYPDDSRADRVGTYLAWNVALTERLDFNTAVRYENINMAATPNFTSIGLLPFERTYQDWIANGALSYLLTDEVRLVGGVYEGFRAPTIDDLTANKTSLQNSQSVPLIGNLAAQPEHSLTYEAGLKVNGERWRMQVMEFWTDFDSFLSRESINNVDFLTNQTAYINGTELNGEYLLASDVSVYGNFYYTYGTQTTTNTFLARIPPTQGILGMRFRMPTQRSYLEVFTWMVDRADRYDVTNMSDVRFIRGGTPGYATLNARAGRAFGQTNQNQVTLSLENITDKYYRVLGSGVDGTGFNAVLGYQYLY